MEISRGDWIRVCQSSDAAGAKTVYAGIGAQRNSATIARIPTKPEGIV